MIDSREKKYIKPINIPYKVGEIVGEQHMLISHEDQIFFTSDEDIRSKELRVSGQGFIVMDFGKEIHGGVRILTRQIKAAPGTYEGNIRIRFGESMSEVFAEILEKNAQNHHSLRDFSTKLINLSDMEFGSTGFRFVRIDFLDDDVVYCISSIYGMMVYRNIPYIGEFACNDERINEIYATARYTVHLNMQNLLWDGIKRDRLVWIGDMHPEVLAITNIFGSDDCVMKSLNLIKGATPLPNWMNNIPSYSIWWIIILWDYYMQNGDISILQDNFGYLDKLIVFVNNHVKNDGELDLPRFFLDWPTNDSEERIAGVHSLFIMGIDRAVKIYIQLEKDFTLPAAILSKLKNKKFKLGEKKQCNALQVLTRQIDPAIAVNLLTNSGASGMSTYMSYYILSAMADGGEVGQAISIMKDYFGAMLDRGATTFWEDFDIDWLDGSGRIDKLPEKGQKDIHGDYGNYCYKGFRHSLCHGWACGALPFLTKYVLGVEILEPGCKKIKISPHLGGLTEVEGKYPTPYGVINIKHSVIDGEVVSLIDAPREIEIVRVTC